MAAERQPLKQENAEGWPAVMIRLGSGPDTDRVRTRRDSSWLEPSSSKRQP